MYKPSDAFVQRARAQLESGILYAQQSILRHQNNIIKMKQRLNSLVAIACLPPEILSEIFLQYQMVIVSEATHPRPYRWLEITHVSHHWREVGLSMPRLWSFVTHVSGLELMKTMIERSKKASLTVSLHDHHYEKSIPMDCLRLVFAQFDRISSIDVRVLPSQYADLLAEGLFPTKVPQLRSLFLYNDSVDWVPEHLPQLLDDCEEVILTTLQLRGYVPRFPNVMMCPSLTKLVITAEDVGSLSEYPPPLVLLNALKDLPLLEHLELKYALHEEHRWQAFERKIPIKLPHIKRFKYIDDGPQYVRFLSHLRFPSTARLFMQLIDTDDVVTNNGAEKLAVRSVASIPDCSDKMETPLRSVSIGWPSGTYMPNIHSMGCVRFVFWTEIIQFCPLNLNRYSFDDLTSQYPSPILDVTFDARSDASVTRYFDLSTTFPLLNIRSLFLGAFQPVHRHALARVLAAMPRVESLRFQCNFSDNPREVLRTLAAVEPASGNNGHAGNRESPQPLQLILPCLRTLELEHIQFRLDGSDTDRFAQDLAEVFRVRAKWDCPIECLVINECSNVKKSDVELFRSLVNTVVWDEDFGNQGLCH